MADPSAKEHPNLATIRRYLAALERGDAFEALRDVFTEDVVQREFPNRLVPNGATRDFAALAEGNEKGKRVIREQKFAIENALVDGDRAALEIVWTGVLQIAVGTLEAGDTMRARFGVFFHFRGGRICEQHNYDCFDAV
jgi:ketosteroid isomerase-like protein